MDEFDDLNIAQELSPAREQKVDEAARAAGAALRVTAPPGGVAGIARSARRVRAVRVAGGTGVAVAVLIGSMFVFGRSDNSATPLSTSVALDSPTMRLRDVGSWTGTVNEAAFNADGSEIAVGNGVEVAFLDTSTLTVRATLPCPVRRGASWDVDQARLWDDAHRPMLQVCDGAMSADGRRVAVDAEDMAATTLYDTVTGVTIATLAGAAPRFSPDGTVLITFDLSTSALGTPTVWDASTGERIASLPAASTMAFNPDGTRLFTSDGVTLSAFDTSDWEVATSKPGAVRQGQLFGLTVSPDGAAVVCNGIHGADVLDTATLARRFEGSPTTDEAFAATFTSDGKVLALSGNSGVLLVDPVTARRLSAVTPPGMRLWLGFSPDGTILATSNQTGLQFFSVESA